MAESILQRKLILGELLDLNSFTNVCKTFVDLYKIGLKVFDAQGTKLVDLKVASGDFCAYMFTGPNGRRLCTDTVTHIKVRPLEDPTPMVRNCFTGLRYLMLPILYEGDMLGRIIFGPFMPEDVGDLGQDLRSLEGEFDLAKARELIARIRRAPEGTVRKIMEHFARIVDVLVYTSHRSLITSQLHIESVTESYREVNEKNKKLSEALERLQELSRLKSNFLATVSHELRTPLTSVIGYSEMLLAGLAGELNEEQKDYLKTILEKGEALLRLISSILDLSRIEARGVQLVRKPTVLADLIQSAMESVLPQSFKKKLQLTTDISANLPKVIIDGDKIRQCVVNLLSNSVKFTPAGGSISVRAGLAEKAPSAAGPFGSAGYFQISVEDNGIGIPGELQQKVFDTFFQADSSASREYGGAGLGLSIVKSYIDAHGGEVMVRSEPGRGSIFTLVLPIEPPSTPLELTASGH
ncbi:MAG: PocR ligand-binding domain-containing protein [Deltaproteobacteria bacterium]|nr:PocR ligand-binding domain-containing protein [Deltaproteobacteria bacterium]